MPRYVMAIDASKCLNCKACLIACQQRNAVPYGLSRNWVRETPDTASPSGWRYQPGACMHCDEPSCVDACPTHATYKAEDAPTKPTLAYLNDVADKHWPKAESAGPVGFMGTVATGVRWLGALSLFGVVGVGLRQLIRPTGEASHEEKRKGS